jgi:integrase
MLTISKIEKIKPPAEGRIVLWDNEPVGSGVPGFGCRVFPSGQRSFIVRYRLPGSRQKQTATLGTYGLITLPQARRKAQEILATVKLGSDPQAERKARAAAEQTAAKLLTVQELARQYSAALRAGTARTSRSNGRPVAAYIADTVMHLERFAARHGKQAAAAITRSDVAAVLHEYVDQPSVHRRMHGAINRMYAWARHQDLVANRPTEDIITTREPARERVLSLDELMAIWRAADQLDPLYRDLVHLMIMTGQRRAEVAGMRWGEIDLAAGLWTLPSGRTKAKRQHTVPLTPLAVSALRTRRDVLQRPTQADGLVLPTSSRDGGSVRAISGWNWLKRELDRRSGISGWRLHDFRRSLVTILAEQGADVAVLDSLLNHASSATRGGVIGVYQRATLIEPMRKLMARWDQLLTDALDDSKVIQFPAKL